jgi:hypothetical protein
MLTSEILRTWNLKKEMLQHTGIQNFYREFDRCRNYITANFDSSLGALSMKLMR